jgi:hypothetical protein
MRPSLTAEMAQVVVDERVEAAERFRRRREARRARAERPDAYGTVTVRLANERDEPALRRLARLDGHGAPPRAPLLVAEADHRLLAARSVADGGSIADPFAHTAHLSELLALRSAHLREDGGATCRKRFAGARSVLRLVARGYS